MRTPWCRLCVATAASPLAIWACQTDTLEASGEARGLRCGVGLNSMHTSSHPQHGADMVLASREVISATQAMYTKKQWSMTTILFS